MFSELKEFYESAGWKFSRINVQKKSAGLAQRPISALRIRLVDIASISGYISPFLPKT